MIGEGTFGAITGGGIGAYNAYQGGESGKNIALEAGVGATIGAGGILGARAIISSNRMGKALKQFEKTDPRFQQYVNDITQKTERLSTVKENIGNLSYDAILDDQYAAVRSAMANPNIPTTIQGLESSMKTIGKKIGYRNQDLENIAKESNKLNEKIRNTRSRVNQTMESRIDTMIKQHTGPSPLKYQDAKKRVKRQIEDELEVRIGKPKRNITFGSKSPGGRTVHQQGYNTLKLPSGKKIQVPFTTYNYNPLVGTLPRMPYVPGYSVPSHEQLLGVLKKNISGKTPADVRQAIVSEFGSSPDIGTIRRNASRGASYGFMPLANNGSPMVSSPNAFVSHANLQQLKRLQSKQGLGYQVEKLEDRRESAKKALKNLREMQEERKNIMQKAQKAAKAEYKEQRNLPKTLKAELEQLGLDKNQYLTDFTQQKQDSIRRSFLGLGG